ncbi:MAG: hypothetical protein IPH57_18285 [Saprospiraceae bacterium]|nr:hypothetical protein [Saprospiraceae bacterium]
MIRYLIVIAFFSVGMISCKTKAPVFEIYQEARFSIPAGKDPVATHHFIIRDIPSFLKANLQQRGMVIDDLTEFYAGKGRFQSLDFDYNFGVIYDLSVWVYKKGEYENRKEVYYRDEVPWSQKGELKLLSTGEDVREILLSDNYEIDVELQFKSVTAQSVDCRFEFNFVAYIE